MDVLGVEPQRGAEVVDGAVRFASLLANGAAETVTFRITRLAGDDLGRVGVRRAVVVAIEVKLGPPEQVACGVFRIVRNGEFVVPEGALGIAALGVAAGAESVNRRPAGIELQHPVAIGERLVERLLDVEFGGAVGIELHVVRFQADGLVEVVERADALPEFEVRVGAVAVGGGDVPGEG